MRIGYHFPPKKLAKQRIGDLLQHLAAQGWTLTPIDLNRPLDAQGPFDVVLHKLTDLIVRSDDDPAAAARLRALNDWAATHPRTVWIDPLPSVVRLTDRIATADALDECLARHPGLFRLPNAVVLSDDRDADALVGLRFPVVVKTAAACGSPDAHLVTIAFEPAQVLAARRGRVLVQEFVRHDNVMLKCYVLNGNVRLDLRTSIELGASAEAVQLDTQTLSKRADAHAKLEQRAQGAVDPGRLQQIACALGETLGLSLFGFDLIVEGPSGEPHVVDVNYFPAYDGVDDFFRQTQALIVAKLRARDTI